MRAAYIPATIIAVGLYLAVAAAFAFTPTWVALGVLAISLGGAIGMVLAERPTTHVA